MGDKSRGYINFKKIIFNPRLYSFIVNVNILVNNKRTELYFLLIYKITNVIYFFIYPCRV